MLLTDDKNMGAHICDKKRADNKQRQQKDQAIPSMYCQENHLNTENVVRHCL